MKLIRAIITLMGFTIGLAGFVLVVLFVWHMVFP